MSPNSNCVVNVSSVNIRLQRRVFQSGLFQLVHEDNGRGWCHLASHCYTYALLVVGLIEAEAVIVQAVGQ